MTSVSATPEAWAVILAAGNGTRLAGALADTSAGTGAPARKQYIEFENAPLFWRSARTFSRVEAVRGLILVFPAQDVDRMGRVVTELYDRDPLGLPWRVCAGGEQRQDSVRLGLAQVPQGCPAVLVHDSARPFASAALVRRVLAALAEGARAVVPGLPVTDTIKRVDCSGTVLETPERASLRAVQTPQGFDLAGLAAAHARAMAEGWKVTDDAGLMERAGCPVVIVAGEEANVKITTPADLPLLAPAASTAAQAPRTGWGYDVHRYLTPDEEDAKLLAKARPMVLGGVPIPGAPRVVAHSDGDVLLHALTDALLGIACAGDIGQIFPDTDAAFENMPSAVFVAKALRRVRACGYRPVHADLTIVAQTPKLFAHKARMAAQVAQLLELPATSVNVKATTEEGLGFTGLKQGIKAVAVVTAMPG